MDSDDELELDALQKLYDKAEHTNLDILYFDGISFLDNDLDETASNQNLDYYKRRCSYSRIYNGAHLMRAMEKNGEYRVSPCLQFIRRDFLIENNLQFEEGIIHEDNLFTFKAMLMADRASHLHESLFRRRYRRASTMTQKTSFEHVYGYFKCFLEMDKFIGEIKLSDEEKISAIAIQRSLLRNARDKYLQLSFEERESIRGLELREKMQFELYIVDWFMERRAVWGAKNRTRAAVDEVKSTETFKIGAAIVWLPRKLKQIVVR